MNPKAYGGVVVASPFANFGPYLERLSQYGTKPAPPAPLGGGSRSASVGNPTGKGTPAATAPVANVARN